MAADVLHVVFGIPYLISTVTFASALALVFATWYAVDRDLSIRAISGARRELFCWATAGGVRLGDGPIAIVLGLLIIAFVTYLSVSRIAKLKGSSRARGSATISHPA